VARIAIPRLKFPKRPPSPGAPPKPRVLALAGAGVALTAVAGVLFLLLLGPGHGPEGAHLSLGAALEKAPPGWRQALKPAHGVQDGGEEVIRLWDRPLSLGGMAPRKATPMIASVDSPLPPAPIDGLYLMGPGGPLPIIAADGRSPFSAYRRPFPADPRPKVALVIRGLGLNAQATRRAIEGLPPAVTLSFIVYADDLQGWIDQARAHGHEVLLEAPMEPMDFPDNDPGPYTLMAQGGAQEMAPRLEWILSRATGYFGVMNYLGERFLGSDATAATLVSALRGRGLAFVDDGLAKGRAAGPLRVSAERAIDASLSPTAIEEQLTALEAGARVRGQALGVGGAYPLTLEKVARWAQDVEQRGVRLAPASALAGAQ